MSLLRYRPEIDGLRAISVIGVVLFHIGLGFPGGFIGVDVFFVISGFLITSILKRDLEAGTFSMVNFWAGRIKRILPAVTAMVLISLIAGYFLLTTAAFHSLAQSSIAQSLMSANLYFWKDAGYFSASADFKPLLHTWSLSVEEQFYILFPIVLIVVGKWRAKSIMPILAIGALASFSLSCYGAINHPTSTFYLLPTRAWELIAGSILAYSTAHHKWNKTTAEILSALGLTMIVSSMFIYDKSTSFPGFNALAPVLGATLFIASNQTSLTYSGRLLSIKPLVWIGLLSYSLYLWHWPIIVFAKHILLDLTLYWKVALLVLSFVSAYVSWRFIETPFRSRKLGSNPKSTLALGALITASSLAIAGFIWKSPVQPAGTINAATQIQIDDIEWAGYDYQLPNASPITPVPIGVQTSSRATFAIWGDSHAMTSIATIHDVALKAKIKGNAYLVFAANPVTNTWKYNDRDKPAQISDKIARKALILDDILASGVSDLILISRWSLSCSGYNQTEQLAFPHWNHFQTMLVDDMTPLPTEESSSRILATALKKMCLKLKQHGVRVWIFRQVPETDHPHPALSFYISKRFPSINQFPSTKVTRTSHKQRQKSANRALDSLAPDLATIIDPSTNSFNDRGHLITHGAERSYYKDDDHLTRAGAAAFLTSSLEALFHTIKNRSSSP